MVWLAGASCLASSSAEEVLGWSATGRVQAIDNSQPAAPIRIQWCCIAGTACQLQPSSTHASCPCSPCHGLLVCDDLLQLCKLLHTHLQQQRICTTMLQRATSIGLTSTCAHQPSCQVQAATQGRTCCLVKLPTCTVTHAYQHVSVGSISPCLCVHNQPSMLDADQHEAKQQPASCDLGRTCGH
jgi:hypothetical protein